MISVEQMRKLEHEAFERGATVEELMERAGKACAEEIEKRLGTGIRIAVFIGPGNNGGDGLVAARYLNEKNDVVVVLVKEPKTDAAKLNYQRAREAGMEFGNVEDAVVIVDAMLGIGARNPLRGEIREACIMINGMAGFKVSIDVPTGVGADGDIDADAVRPNATICLHDCKEGCEKAGGELWIADIGL